MTSIFEGQPLSIFANTWIFQVCKIAAFSPKKPTKRQKFYISGRPRYTIPMDPSCVIEKSIETATSTFQAHGKSQRRKTFVDSERFEQEVQGVNPYFWSNYSDLTRPHPKWWFSKGNPMKSPYFRKIQVGEIL